MAMDELDLALRNLTYRLFVDLGRAPSADEAAAAAHLAPDAVLAGWRRLADEHAIVMNDTADALLMANPFSAVPTQHRVEVAGRSWFANCAWDAFGICAALDADGVITTSCPCCGDELAVEVRDRRPRDQELLFHCLVPASHWWDNIVFT